MQPRAPDPIRWLAQTKFQPPLLRADLIPRLRLLASLHEALFSCRLTLISAPAGYAKTTLLAALTAAMPGLPLAWLSVDGEDSDLQRFLTALVLALRRPYPNYANATLSLLARPASSGLEPHHVAAALINDLLESITGESVLVLDDLHLVSDPAVYAALDYFVARMPPQMHVAVGTRRDPPLSLARLRARNELAEFRLRDVRFALQEAGELLNDRSGLDLDASDLGRLHARIEGWPAGLHMLAISLSKLDSPARRSAFIADLGPVGRYLFDYLSVEVLDREDSTVRAFLLETSILPDLTSALCRAVTGREDAAAILEDLDRRSLFITTTEENPTTFRYHALFADFLRARLQQEAPQRIAELHGRAAEATPVPGRAISHYLAAGRWEEAGTAIEQIAWPLLRSGVVSTVGGWIQALPAEVRARRPRLTLFQGICSFFQGDLPAAKVQLENALQALEGSHDEDGAGDALAHLAICAYHQADLAGADALVQRALARPLSAPQRVQMLMMRCMLDVLHRPWSEALASLDAALAEAEAAGTLEMLEALTFYLRLDLAAMPGALERIEGFLRWAVPLVGDRPTPVGVAVQEWVIFAHLWRGRLHQATEASARALAVAGRLGGNPWLGLQAVGFGAMAHLARGDYAAAGRLLELTFRWLAAIPLGQVYIAAALYTQGRLRLLQGDREGARQSCQDLWAAARDQESTEAPALRWKLRAQVAIAERRYAAAERALREAVGLEEKMPGAKLFGSAHLLLARLAYERNRPEAALAELAPLLAECEQQNTPGLILVDGADATPVLRLALRHGLRAAFAERLLSLLDPATRHRTVAVAETGEVLSAREIEVLELLASGDSSRAIAGRLVIAETTVKSHITSILRKLNVSSRTQAAARARELGLVSSSPIARTAVQ